MIESILGNLVGKPFPLAPVGAGTPAGAFSFLCTLAHPRLLIQPALKRLRRDARTPANASDRESFNVHPAVNSRSRYLCHLRRCRGGIRHIICCVHHFTPWLNTQIACSMRCSFAGGSGNRNQRVSVGSLTPISAAIFHRGTPCAFALWRIIQFSMLSSSLLDRSSLICYHLLDDDFIIPHDERLFKSKGVKFIIPISTFSIFY